MAVLETIRKQSVLLLIFIGLAMVAFVMGDMFKNQGAGAAYTDIGQIFGESIDVEAYEMRVQQEIQKIEQQGGQANSQQVRDQVWFQMISEMVLNPEVDELGITVSAEELSDMIYGNNVHPEVINNGWFNDTATGQYSQQIAINIRRQAESDPGARNFWVNVEDYLTRLRVLEEYNNLIEKGFYATTAQAQFDYASNSNKLNYRTVVLKYSGSPDSLVSFTEDEVVAKYEEIKHLKQYEQLESRDIEYVEFIVDPTEADRAYARSLMDANLIQQFAETTNDSLFVVRKGSSQFYSSQYFKSGDFEAEADSLIFKADSGEIVGPYYNAANDSYDIAKITGIRYDTVASVRHILLKTGTDDDAAVKTRADSIQRAIERGADFAELVTKYSEDPGSIATGGAYENFPRGQMVTEFEDFSFDKPVGSIGTVKTTFGYHIMEVLAHDNARAVQVAIVDAKVSPSQGTKDAAYAKALDFAMQNRTAEAFEAKASELGYNILRAERITPDMRSLTAIENATSIIKWAYEAQQGEVSSQPFTVGNRIVIPHLTQVREEGVPELDDIRILIEPMVIKDKKAEMFSTQLAGSDINQIAANTGATVLENRDLSFSSNTIVGGGGNEPAVVGRIWAMADAGVMGQVSQPIIGEVGVYVVVVDEVIPAQALTDYSAERTRLTQSWRSNLVNGNGFYQGPVYRALEEKADLKDYRKKVELLNN